jgi:hypothetical protein
MQVGTPGETPVGPTGKMPVLCSLFHIERFDDADTGGAITPAHDCGVLSRGQRIEQHCELGILFRRQAGGLDLARLRAARMGLCR